MLVRRLTWAGLEIEAGDDVLVIDLLARKPALSKYAGDPKEELHAPAAAPGTVSAAAVTHLHTDHLDIESLRTVLAPDAPLLCPAAAAEAVRDAGFAAHGMEPWERTTIGELELTAVPAVDGFGAPQVSWVVSHGATRLIHCGDTLWHGHWWQIAERCGPIDHAFLPVNGAVVEFDYLEPPSLLSAVLSPEQAAAAAQILGVRQTSPIHYGTFHNPPFYASLPDPASAFATAARRRGVTVRLLEAGDEMELSPLAQSAS